MKHPISTRAHRLQKAIRKLDKRRRKDAEEGRVWGRIRSAIAERRELGALLRAEMTHINYESPTAFDRWHQEQMRSTEYRMVYERELKKLRGEWPDVHRTGAGEYTIMWDPEDATP